MKGKKKSVSPKISCDLSLVFQVKDRKNYLQKENEERKCNALNCNKNARRIVIMDQKCQNQTLVRPLTSWYHCCCTFVLHPHESKKKRASKITCEQHLLNCNVWPFQEEPSGRRKNSKKKKKKRQQRHSVAALVFFCLWLHQLLLVWSMQTRQVHPNSYP